MLRALCSLVQGQEEKGQIDAEPNAESKVHKYGDGRCHQYK
jgi:hypothetical protein